MGMGLATLIAIIWSAMVLFSGDYSDVGLVLKAIAWVTILYIISFEYKDTKHYE